MSAKLNEIGWWYFLPDDGVCGLAILAAVRDPPCAVMLPTASSAPDAHMGI